MTPTPSFCASASSAVDVGGGDVDVAALGFVRGAGVAGRDQHFVDARRLRQLPGQRVLATAGTDDQDFHVTLLVA